MALIHGTSLCFAGNAIHSTPVFSPSFVHILRRHVQELHLLRVTGPLSASFLPLAQLSQLTHLQILAAPECSLQDTAADDCLSQILALLPRLEHLELSSHQPVLLSSHLSSLQRLEYLEIASEIGGGFLSALPSMPALTSLVLNRLGANDDSNATPLSTCKTSMQALASLQHLTLANFVLPGEESELCGLSLLTGVLTYYRFLYNNRCPCCFVNTRCGVVLNSAYGVGCCELSSG